MYCFHRYDEKNNFTLDKCILNNTSFHDFNIKLNKVRFEMMQQNVYFFNSAIYNYSCMHMHEVFYTIQVSRQ